MQKRVFSCAFSPTCATILLPSAFRRPCFEIAFSCWPELFGRIFMICDCPVVGYYYRFQKKMSSQYKIILKNSLGFKKEMTKGFLPQANATQFFSLGPSSSFDLILNGYAVFFIVFLFSKVVVDVIVKTSQRKANTYRRSLLRARCSCVVGISWKCNSYIR